MNLPAAHRSLQLKAPKIKGNGEQFMTGSCLLMRFEGSGVQTWSGQKTAPTTWVTPG